MTSANIRDAEVIICGGGPVGMGLAIDLGQRSVRCLVIEKYPSPQPVPKGQNLTQRTMEHFRAWRAEDELRAARTVPVEFGIGGMTAYRTLLSGYSYDWLKRELVRPYYMTDNERLPQYETERVLRGRAAELDTVEILYGWEVDGIDQDAEGVAVSAFERKGEARRRFTASYLVGADGNWSIVRESAGVTQTRFDRGRTMVLLVFQSDELHRLLLDRFPGKSFYSVLHPDLEGYWLFFGRVDLEGEFFFHAPVPNDADRERYDFTPSLHKAVGAEFDVDIRHKGFWDSRVAIADSFWKGRVFVAGDAAHSHPPYGGYGINTGFEDARNLGWKLAAVLRGWGGADLLASYDRERRPVFWSTAKDFIEKSIETDRAFLAAFDPEKDKAAFEAEWAARGSGAVSEVNSFQPNYRGSAVVFGTGDGAADAVGDHSFVARAGYHLAPRELAEGGNVYDRLGQDFTLIGLDVPEPEIGAFEDAARRLSIPLTVVRASLAGEMKDYEATRILVRPDHFVAWAATAPAQAPKDVLRRSCGLQTAMPVAAAHAG